MTPEALRAFFDHLNRSEFEAIEARLDDAVTFEFPGQRFGGLHAGKRRVMLFLRANQRLFQGGLAFTVHWAGVDGDRGAVQWTNAGTTLDGRPYANRGVTLFRWSGETIVEIQDYLDTERIAATWPA